VLPIIEGYCSRMSSIPQE